MALQVTRASLFQKRIQVLNCESFERYFIKCLLFICYARYHLCFVFIPDTSLIWEPECDIRYSNNDNVSTLNRFRSRETTQLLPHEILQCTHTYVCKGMCTLYSLSLKFRWVEYPTQLGRSGAGPMSLRALRGTDVKTPISKSLAVVKYFNNQKTHQRIVLCQVPYVIDSSLLL